MPVRLIVAGCGTGVGKTVVSTLLTYLLEGAYWKPIETGTKDSSDTSFVQTHLPHAPIFPPAYSFFAPLSPHAAASLEKKEIDPSSITPPSTSSPLIIESVGGVYVPLTDTTLSIDLFASWKALWIVVSSHYLGSINHTLLTLEALQKRGLPIAGVIFNGKENEKTEKAILQISSTPYLGRVEREAAFTEKTLEKYREKWKDITKILSF